ncbi:MAG: hypothetical protein V1858_00125, partial [Candidatus Gottesmanbacteria bacterium]
MKKIIFITISLFLFGYSINIAYAHLGCVDPPTCGSCGCGADYLGTCYGNECNNWCCCQDDAWSAWSTCTKTCGGGTQSRTNGCNYTQSQACNTQPCVTPTPTPSPSPSPSPLVSPSPSPSPSPAASGYPGIVSGVSLSNDVQNKTSSKGWQVAPEDLSSSGIKAFGANQYKYDYTHYADK